MQPALSAQCAIVAADADDATRDGRGGGEKPFGRTSGARNGGLARQLFRLHQENLESDGIRKPTCCENLDRYP
jgi:hypothetical protein